MGFPADRQPHPRATVRSPGPQRVHRAWELPKESFLADGPTSVRLAGSKQNADRLSWAREALGPVCSAAAQPQGSPAWPRAQRGELRGSTRTHCDVGWGMADGGSQRQDGEKRMAPQRTAPHELKPPVSSSRLPPDTLTGEALPSGGLSGGGSREPRVARQRLGRARFARHSGQPGAARQTGSCARGTNERGGRTTRLPSRLKSTGTGSGPECGHTTAPPRLGGCWLGA